MRLIPSLDAVNKKKEKEVQQKAIDKDVHKVHTYVKRRRRNLETKAKTDIYRCILPGCSHYLTEEFIEGKYNTCVDCKEVFVIEGKHYKGNKVKIVCGCEAEKKRKRKELMSNILGD